MPGSTTTSLRQRWALFCLISLFWASVIALLFISMRMNDGHIIYPLDDTYIHMAMAKNSVLHHVWGVTKHGFTSATSSPLWTAMIAAAYFIFGVNEIAPLVMSLVLAIVLIVMASHYINLHVKSQVVSFIIMAFAVLAAPLQPLAMSGMEHVLHTLLTLCFLFMSSRILGSERGIHEPPFTGPLILAALLPMARYESLFLILTVCVLLFFTGRLLRAIILGLTALVPITAYGILSISKGWHFLPNSIILKGHTPDLSLDNILRVTEWHSVTQILANPHVFVLFVVILLLACIGCLPQVRARIRNDDTSEIWYAALILLGTIAMHMQFASVGWFYRYEAYLLFAGTIVCGIGIARLFSMFMQSDASLTVLKYVDILLLLLCLIAIPFQQRSAVAITRTPQAMNNIYEQQYQMARFIRAYYQNQTIALNDIGAVSYLADIKLLDLWGLASLEAARLKLENRWGATEIYDLCRRSDVKIAILYERWFNSKGSRNLPPQFIKAGQWSIPNNVVCGDYMVSLFAVDPAALDELMRNVGRFSSELPADVVQRIAVRDDAGGAARP